MVDHGQGLNLVETKFIKIFKITAQNHYFAP